MSAPTPAARRRRSVHGAFRNLIGVLLAGVAIGVITAPGAGAPSSEERAGQPCSTSSTLASNPAAVDDIEEAAQQDFLGRLNELRRSKGLISLAWNSQVTGPSIDWSETMSAQIPPGGSASDPGWLHHARDTGSDDGVEPSQDYVTINSRLVRNWQRLAENVGVGGMRSSCSFADLQSNTDRVVVALHNAFVGSAGHYRNMVGDHNQVGIGVHIDENSLWVTVRFAKGDLPSASAGTVSPQTESYIDSVYSLFLERPAEDTEERRWAPGVEAGDRLTLTSALATSDSWAGTRINDLYRTVLGRNADGSGRSYWVGQIARGLQLEIVAVEFYGSPEYYGRNGSANSRYVQGLYRDLLGRDADAGGLGYWSGRLDRGEMSRSTVAIGFYGSKESRTDRATSLYHQVFGAKPSAAAVAPWADRLSTAGDIRTAAEMAASNTYYHQSAR